MSPSPDPEYPEPDKSLMQLREIFREAAEKSTGPGKPKFERLSKAFNAYQDAADTGIPATFQRAEQEFRAAMADAQLFAKTDPDTAKILLDVSKAVIEAQNAEVPKKKRNSKHWRL